MIEIALGLLIIAGACTVAAGLAGFDPLPLVGYGGIAALIALGALLVVAGALRRAIARDEERRHALRSARLALGALLLVGALAAGPALTAELFNLVHVVGLAGGYYFAAEAALIGLVVTAFLWAARQERIDREGQARD